MKCPRCGSEELAVVDSRADENSIRRRRECQDCKTRFTTFERVELSLPMVIKKDGRREQFDREKIRAGIVRACEKRPVSVDEVDRSVESLELKVSELCLREIPSRQIGELVMEVLKKLDTIAYVRFASVYREFSDVSQFVDTLQGLTEARGAPKAANEDS
ncbi:MAG: transcriptional regulator NrdR [Oligoflexia bacterium]|nr:transcriptional regulator NrdR [Oligoflexia bacterium]